MKTLLAAILIISPLAASAAVPKAPTLLLPQVVSSTEIRWFFKNNEPKAVAFELWDVLGRRMISQVANPKATYIAETNVVPADPDMACGRYVVAVDDKGGRSFGQVMTYPCVRTPPVAPPVPTVEIIDSKIINVTASSGDNDPASGIGIYEIQRGNWVSPGSMFVAEPEMLTPGAWGADIGSKLIGLRPNSSYTFAARAQSVTGELSKWSEKKFFRMPAEKGDAFAPSLSQIGESTGLLGKTLIQTFVTKKQMPTIAGIVKGDAVTVTLDDRPYLAEIKGTGEVKSFSFTPTSKIGEGYHYIRLGAHRDGTIAWTPTVEFVVKK